MARLLFNIVSIGTLFLLIQTVRNTLTLTVKEPSNREPLLLSPYIERGDLEAARKASLAESLLGDNIINYAGFFTVNKAYNSNMFFWFFPAEKDSLNAPFIVWLTGGPGVSSIYGLFELGPYILNKDQQLSKRPLYWSQKYNVIYFDNPIGTGFSFTDNDNGYSRTQSDFGENLYSGIKQFFQVFPEYKKNDFYIAGSSYGGKYVPAFGYIIDQKEKKLSDNEKINLKGLMIANGFSDPVSIIQRSEILFETGLIGVNGKLELDSYINRMVSLINQQKYGETMDVNTPMREVLVNNTGYEDLYNLLFNKVVYPFGNISNYVTSENVREKIHVGNVPFYTDPKVHLYLRSEIFQSIKPWVEVLLEKYKILYYSGQLDLEIPYVLNSKYLQTLNWSGAEKFKNAERKIWYMGDELVGYKQTGGKLSEVMVRNAGHASRIDKPKAVFEMITDFINNSAN